MAMNNPYAAYQKFAKNSQIQKEIKGNDKSENQVAPIINTVLPNGVQSRPSSTNVVKPNQYLESAVMTATPEELTLMLYDGAIKFMNQAIIFIQMKQVEKAHNAVVRAQDIFTELMSTLNMEYPIAQNLYSIYDFIFNSLLQANTKKDPNIIREMISLARELRNTWAQAMKSAKKG
ncbi:MAG: flagellar secretion chaperone FliS [Clostridiales bacterium]|nr:flagellar secretion chaperone FliS [Clostridiales bacterium]